MYPYAIRVQDMQEDFKEYQKKVDEVEKDTQKKIKKMSARFEKVQGIYVTKKHQQFE